MPLEDSRFLDSWMLSDIEIQSQLSTNVHHDLITFLTMVQRMEIDLLPIAPEVARGVIGGGATSDVNESLINIQTSFAFKRVSDSQKTLPESQVLKALTNEISILGQPQIRQHPNIIHLQGICWDVESDTKIWPTLVFEKTELGDLHTFLSMPIGKALNLDQRFKICKDVGKAILDMHSTNLVHGDIKPENVLVFKNNRNEFSARVADFGYSTWFAGEQDTFVMPKSWPWNAPEHSHRHFTPADAKRIDVFSFGMLCLWTLFQGYLSGSTPLPPEMSWANDYLDHGDSDVFDLGDKYALEKLKDDEKLIPFAAELLASDMIILENEERNALGQFFAGALAQAAQERTEAFLIFFLEMPDPSSSSSPLLLPKNDLNMSNLTFDISRSIRQFYESDYQIRTSIFHRLEERVLSAEIETSANELFQLALCYSIGFGTPGNQDRSAEYLIQSGIADEILQKTVEDIYTKDHRQFLREDTTFKRLVNEGYIARAGFSERGLDVKQLQRVEAEISRELKEIEDRPRMDNFIGLTLIETLAMVYIAQGKWSKAENLQKGIVAARTKMQGRTHSSTLSSLSDLASTYRRQGLYKDAEKILQRIVELRREWYGLENPITLTTMAHLASTYLDLGRWKDAEALSIFILNTRKRVLGPEHVSTITSMGSLASTYRKQCRWKAAEELNSEALKLRKSILGPDHPATQTSMMNLASTYQDQGLWTQAQTLQQKVLQNRKRTLGADHPSTLATMSDLGTILCLQGRLSEAETIAREAITISNRELGVEHPTTITFMSNLASVVAEQGRWKEAESLELKSLDMLKRTKGPEHHDTIQVMSNLVVTYKNQGRWREAETTIVQALEIQIRSIGSAHPKTLANMNNLASIHRSLGRWKEAESLQNQVLEVKKAVLGAEHPNTIHAMESLASIYLEQGRHKAAEELYDQVLALSRRVLHPEDPSIITTLSNLASALAYQGRLREAEMLQVEAIDKQRSQLGVEHPDTITNMNNLMSTYMNQSRWKEAQGLGIQVVEASMRKMGASHPHTLLFMGNLASMYSNLEMWKEAEDMETNVFKVRTQVLGPEHPHTLTSMNNLAFVLKGSGRNAEACDLLQKCVELQEKEMGVEHPFTRSSRMNLIRLQTETMGIAESS